MSGVVVWSLEILVGQSAVMIEYHVLRDQINPTLGKEIKKEIFGNANLLFYNLQVKSKVKHFLQFTSEHNSI